jgi:hypothetical protein
LLFGLVVHVAERLFIVNSAPVLVMTYLSSAEAGVALSVAVMC